MKVLLLHPEDAAESYPSQHWDLVVDLGRAPAGTYERWSRQAGSHVISIYDHAEEIEDLQRLRELLQLGTGRMVDQWGIDWWDVLSLEIVPQLQQLLLVHRVSKELGAGCELYSTRPHHLATALRRLLGARLTILENPLQSVIRRARHYQKVFAHLDKAQLAQVIEDKLDGKHSIRRQFAGRRNMSGRSFILLPSAYVNVSRTAVAYAKLLPDRQFLLALTRSNAKLPSLPANVRSASLSQYFASSDQREIASLIQSWSSLRKQLVEVAEEFRTTDAVGELGRVPALLSWGIALRDAWNQLFESENVTACLSADDSNPPSSIPLILAKKRGLPALSVHHGALNYAMAIKTNHADLYLAKSEMERDYLRRICRLPPEKIVIAGLVSSTPLSLRIACSVAPWLVFFTEPYQSFGWRSDEIYRDLLPRLYAIAQTCGLKLVFNLHPFENIKTHRRMLRRLLPEQGRNIEVLKGPPSDQLWSNTRFAMTVQSSTALECAALGIPVFLCAWLRDPCSGYVRQYARYGVGHVLESPEQIAEIPGLLASQYKKSPPLQASGKAVDSDELARLFQGPTRCRWRAMRDNVFAAGSIATDESTGSRVEVAMRTHGASRPITIFTPSSATEDNTNAQNLTVKEIVARLPPEFFRVIMISEGKPDPRIAARKNTKLLPYYKHGNMAQLLIRGLAFSPDMYFYPRTGPLDQAVFVLRKKLRLRMAVVTYIVMEMNDVTGNGLIARSIVEGDAVLANSAYVAETVRRRFGVRAGTIYDGIDRRFFFPSKEPPSPHRAGRMTVLYAGSFQPRKRVELVIQQATRWPDVIFRLAGRGETEAPCRALAEQLQCRNVKFLGHLSSSELGEEMRLADIFLFPSILEGHPQVLGQAAACGLPVVAMNVYRPEYVLQGETGFLAESDVELGQRLDTLLRNSAMRQSMASAAARHSRQFDWDRITEQWIGVFRDVLAERRKA